MTKDSVQSLAITILVGGLFLSLLPVVDLMTAVPVAGGISVLTVLMIHWFVPYATTREMQLEDVRQGFWHVQSPETTSYVTEVIAVSRDDSRVKLALRDCKAYSAERTQSVSIAELRDLYKRWRRSPLPATGSVPRDLGAVKRLVTAVVTLRPHGDVCSCATARAALSEWAEQERLADLDALLDGAVVFGMLREQDGEIRLTEAGRVLLETQTIPDERPEPAVNQSRNELTLNNSPGSTIIVQYPQSARDDDERIVKKLLDKIADNHKIMERELPEPALGQVGAQTQVLNDALSSRTLRTTKVRQALCILQDIARQMPAAVLGSAVVEVLKHLFG